VLRRVTTPRRGCDTHAPPRIRPRCESWAITLDRSRGVLPHPRISGGRFP
jgi:hypothetical protein